MLEVEIYFTDLSYEFVEQVPAYEVDAISFMAICDDFTN